MSRESKMKHIPMLALVIAGACCASSTWADPQPGDIRVTDPAQIAALGFDPVHDEVWLAPAFDSSTLLAERLARAKAAPQVVDPTVDPVWTSVAAPDFHFRGQDGDYVLDYRMSIFCNAGSPQSIADAAIEFPSDHRITWMDFWGVDSSSTAGVEVALYEICQRVDDPDVSLRTVVKLGSIDTGASPAPGPLWANTHVGPNRWVRSVACGYMVRATFSSCVGSDVRLQKVRVLWDYE